ncbi:hypothetical protein ApDm4_0448 [Acetobacter pomorum]|nr:hypothetical protein ApDm4_0448 [Acetobacter pomorum]
MLFTGISYTPVYNSLCRSLACMGRAKAILGFGWLAAFEMQQAKLKRCR